MSECSILLTPNFLRGCTLFWQTVILRRALQSRKDRLQVKADKQNATKTTTLAKCRVLCLLEMLSGGQRARFVHAVSDRSSMSAVALLAKQVEVSVMDHLCKCCPRRQNPTLHFHVVSLGICCMFFPFVRKGWPGLTTFA